jgi:hypothetical protein
MKHAWLCLALATWTLASCVAAAGEGAVHQERVAKCRAVWASSAPWSYSPALCEFFVSEHERQGIGDQWFWSTVYSKANFGMTLRKRAPGPCYSPMDCQFGSYARQAGARRAEDLRDPRLNIRAHVTEMAAHHHRYGETGMALLARVFYPARPMRYHRWPRVEREHRAILAKWYAKKRGVR